MSNCYCPPGKAGGFPTLIIPDRSEGVPGRARKGAGVHKSGEHSGAYVTRTWGSPQRIRARPGASAVGPGFIHNLLAQVKANRDLDRPLAAPDPRRDGFVAPETTNGLHRGLVYDLGARPLGHTKLCQAPVRPNGEGDHDHSGEILALGLRRIEAITRDRLGEPLEVGALLGRSDWQRRRYQRSVRGPQPPACRRPRNLLQRRAEPGPGRPWAARRPGSPRVPAASVWACVGGALAGALV